MNHTKLLIFILIGSGLTFSDTYFREYHYVKQKLTWTEAQKYCREKYSDLATIESVEDLGRLNRPSGDTSLLWIGLNDDPKSWLRVMSNDSNSWRWSATGKTSDTGYQNWRSAEPNNELERAVCVFIDVQGGWVDSHCHSKLYFFCINESNPPGQRNLIKRPLTWTEAQTYCRTHHTDLATIENAQANTELKSVMTTNSISEAWIGLHRVRWRWSDNYSSFYTNWRYNEPNRLDEHCVIEDSAHAWHDVSCHKKLYFWCYKDLRVKKTMVRMKIQTFADLSHPTTNAQVLQQLSGRFKTLQVEVKLEYGSLNPGEKTEDADEDNR